VLTLFSIPKAFAGHVGEIQRNALRSWCALPDVQVVLVGDEEGVRAAAGEAGVEHVGGVLTNERGTPRLDDAFARIEGIAQQPLRCFVNGDIVLLDDFLPAVRTVASAADPFLIVGETIDVAVTEVLALERPDVREELAARARADGRSRGATAIDYFVFTPGLFDPIPPFVVGRARFDNWLVWRGRSRGAVVDATGAVLGVHQRHDYAHVAGGQDEAHFGVEAAGNLALAEGKRQLYTIYDASHKLARDGALRRNLGATLRLRENARKASWKLRHR
jgi:hypothetical protein